MRKFSLSIIIILLVVSFATSFSITLSDIVDASSNMKTVKLDVYAENHYKGRVNKVEFLFWYQREGNKMRIEYLSPKNMKGMTIAIDGKYFYNYIPSLNRKIKKEISTNSKNPGKDMGILYDYVLGDINKVCEKAEVVFLDTQELKIGNQKFDTLVIEFDHDGIVEKAWFDNNLIFPMKIEIYEDNKLKALFLIKNIELNKELNQNIFSPF